MDNKKCDVCGEAPCFTEELCDAKRKMLALLDLVWHAGCLDGMQSAVDAE